MYSRVYTSCHLAKKICVNPPLLVFDTCIIGFCRRYRKRFEVLGIGVCEITSSWKDFIVEKYVKRKKAILVTRDKDFEGTKYAIVLKSRKYEEMWSELWKKLRQKNTS